MLIVDHLRGLQISMTYLQLQLYSINSGAADYATGASIIYRSLL